MEFSYKVPMYRASTQCPEILFFFVSHFSSRKKSTTHLLSMATTIFLDSVSALLRQDNLPYTVVGGLAVIVLVSWLSYLNDPLRSIPGPFWARWGPAWLVYWARDGTMHRKMISMHQKYGKLVRTAPNEVSFSNPEYLKVVYG